MTPIKHSNPDMTTSASSTGSKRAGYSAITSSPEGTSPTITDHVSREEAEDALAVKQQLFAQIMSRNGDMDRVDALEKLKEHKTWVDIGGDPPASASAQAAHEPVTPAPQLGAAPHASIYDSGSPLSCREMLGQTHGADEHHAARPSVVEEDDEPCPSLQPGEDREDDEDDNDDDDDNECLDRQQHDKQQLLAEAPRRRLSFRAGIDISSSLSASTTTTNIWGKALQTDAQQEARPHVSFHGDVLRAHFAVYSDEDE